MPFPGKIWTPSSLPWVVLCFCSLRERLILHNFKALILFYGGKNFFSQGLLSSPRIISKMLWCYIFVWEADKTRYSSAHRMTLNPVGQWRSESIKKPQSFCLKMWGDVNPKCGCVLPLQPLPPNPWLLFDCSAVLMPTIYNGEELGLVSTGLGMESGLRGVWLTAEPWGSRCRLYLPCVVPHLPEAGGRAG
jgi:hypothetical protein